MGMFDEVRVLWPLPWPEMQDATWQSKDTPVQYLDHYEIREDGSLWHKAYDPRYEEDAEAPFGFVIHHDNERWEREPFVGELEVHGGIQREGEPNRWYSVRFWFRDGLVADEIYEADYPCV